VKLTVILSRLCLPPQIKLNITTFFSKLHKSMTLSVFLILLVFRLVSRRLSLPVPHRSHENASPMSQRSVLIAAAIANIKVSFGFQSCASGALEFCLLKRLVG